MTRTKKAHNRDRKSTPARSAAASPDVLQRQIEDRLATVEPEAEVLAVEVIGSHQAPRLRVFLDRPGGVDLDLCARVTHHLRDLLVDYGVEVSSPGPERPLTKLDHYRRYVGRRVRIRTAEAIDGRSDFKGELLGVDADSVLLALDGGMVRVPHRQVRRANLISQPDGSRRKS
jgi:ribosome maturation factor RimP